MDAISAMQATVAIMQSHTMMVIQMIPAVPPS